MFEPIGMYKKRDWATKVRGLHFLWIINVCSRIYENPSNSCSGISVVDKLTDTAMAKKLVLNYSSISVVTLKKKFIYCSLESPQRKKKYIVPLIAWCESQVSDMTETPHSRELQKRICVLNKSV